MTRQYANLRDAQTGTSAMRWPSEGSALAARIAGIFLLPLALLDSLSLRGLLLICPWAN